MPAIITHHVFGTEVYIALSSCIGASEEQRLAFYLGNIGPDSLLCFKMAPVNVPYKKLGGLMHAQATPQLLLAFHNECVASCYGKLEGELPTLVVKHHTAQGDSAIPEDDQCVLRAYALGFLCHYLLDSTVHPLVYAQENAIKRLGVAGIAPRQVAGAAHALIETEIDELLLTRKFGVTVKEFAPHREILVCPEKPLLAISKCYAAIAREVYGLQVPDWLFQSSVHAYRAAQYLLEAKRVGLRSHIDYARILPQYPHILALSHEARLRIATTFSNDDHVPWEHPFIEGKVVDASFDDLYKSAYAKAIEYIPKFAQPDFSMDECLQLTGNLNFRGQEIECDGCPSA